MAKQGRKIKPTALKLIEGNAGKRPLNALEAKPEKITELFAPDWMNLEARRLFMEKAPMLARIGLLTKADVDMFGAYCEAFVTWRTAKDALNAMEEEFGATAFLTKTHNGTLIQNPLVGVANTAFQQVNRLAAEFGLTPSSRTGIDVEKQADRTESVWDRV